MNKIYVEVPITTNQTTLSIPCGDDESLWHFTVIFNENEYLHRRLVTVMDKDVKADIKLSVYYCKECKIITAEW